MTFHAWSLVFLRLGAWLLVGGLSGVVVWGVFDLVAIYRGELAGNSISLAAMRALYGWSPWALAGCAVFVGLLVGTLLAHFGWALGPARWHPGLVILAGLVLGLAAGIATGRFGWVLPVMRMGP